MKRIFIVFAVFLFACNDTATEKHDTSSLQKEREANEAAIADNKKKIEEARARVENSDSNTMADIQASISTQDSLYKLIDSLTRRQHVLDSLLGR